MPPTQPPLPIYYSVSGSDPKPLPSTGMFSSVGKQSSAVSKEDAVASNSFKTKYSWKKNMGGRQKGLWLACAVSKRWKT